MKHITVSLDDDAYRKVEIAAALRGVTVSGLVSDYLSDLALEAGELDKLKKLEEAFRGQIVSFTASDRLSRDEVHQRTY